ncbi:MAG: CBS domain-containing protein, partial [Aquificota bacterium]
GEPLVYIPCTLRSAFEVIKQGGKGYVLLMEQGKPVGILTERDVVMLLAEGVSLEEPAIKYASKNLITVREDRDVYYAVSLMLENGVRRLIVVDERGGFLGTLTMERLVSFIDEELLKRDIYIKDILSKRPLIYIEPDTKMMRALELMKENNVGALPILDKDGRPVGIITERDIVRRFDSVNPNSPVRLYMSSPVVCISPEETVKRALEVMRSKNIRRLVVVEGERAVGVISMRDLLSCADEGYERFLERRLRHTRDIINLFPEPIVELVDFGDQQVVFWENRRSFEEFGKLIDKPITALIPEKEWAYMHAILLKKGKIEGYRVAINSKVYEVSGTYIKLSEKEREKGRIKLLLKDMSEHILKEERIKKELGIYHRIINSTEDMIIVYEAESGLIKLFNSAVMRKLGYSYEELNNLTIFDVVQLDPQQLRHNIDRIVRKGEVIRGRRFYRDIHGGLLPVEVVATKVELNYTPHILIVARDISEFLRLEGELKKKAEKLELIHDFLINLNRCTSEEEAYNLLAHILLNFFNINTVAIYRVNPSPNKLVDALIYGDLNYVRCLEQGEEPTACKVFQSPE